MTIRQECEAHLPTFANVRQRGFERAPRGLFARPIAVKTERDGVAQTEQAIQVFIRGRGSKRCDREIDAMPRQRDNVHIALNDDKPVDVSECLTGLPEAVELTALVEQHGFRRIQVLRFAVAHGAAAKADTTPTGIPNWEHHPVAKAIVVPAIVLADHEAGGEQAIDSLV